MHKWNADEYASQSKAQAIWARELLDTITLRGHEHILDIGCGDGKHTAMLAERVPDGRVVGMDRSEDMVAHARDTYGNKTDTLRFETSDASNLPYENEFDFIFSNACLHWIRDHGPVLKGIDKALRPGGRILLSMGGKGNIATVEPTVRSVMECPEWREFFVNFEPTYGFHGPEEYEPWLDATHLRPTRIELIPKDMMHTPAQFEGWFCTTGLPYTQCIPEDQRDTFIADVIERYHTVNPVHADGLFHTPMIRLEIEADKA